MKYKIFVCLAALSALGAATNVVNRFGLPEAKVTVKVVDENLKPVEHARVAVVFGDIPAVGMTDANGLFTAEGYCNISGVGSSIKKDGYYFGSAPIPKFQEYDKLLNHWQPWNETFETILRPIVKPVALYAKKIQIDVPVLGQPCGYDLEMGDWVAPYGKGLKKDLIFNILKKEVKDALDFDAQGELTFSNPLDGVQEASIHSIGKNSRFRWERLAPEDGYQIIQKLQNTCWNSLGQKPVRSFKFDSTEWEGYFFRVRTVEQDGKIVSACYGKIRGGIQIEPRESKTCQIIFTYYFNPNLLDRNLEWDAKHNLFGGLSSDENPREP